MIKKIFFTLIFAIILFIAGKAQILTIEPENATTDDYVTITYDATLGNAALAGYSHDVYT